MKSRVAGQRREIRVGCSGWNYKDWRDGVFYPPRLPARAWLEYYARHFDTVEVNSTFYRLPTVKAVQGWVEQTPPEFCFAVKMSRYVTHLKRLIGVEESIARFYERIEPLLESSKLGPILWQLPPNFPRDNERLAHALGVLPKAQRHCFEFRHPSWFVAETYELLREQGVALVIADRPEVKSFQAHSLTTDWTLVRFHHGSRGRRGNYSETELEEWARRFEDWARVADIYAYFNNDWEGFAIENARYLKSRLERDRAHEADTAVGR